MNTPETTLLARAGAALFGERWQTDIARELGLSDARRVRQWMAGDRRIPPGVWPDILRLLLRRKAALDELVGEFGVAGVEMQLGKLPVMRIQHRAIKAP